SSSRMKVQEPDTFDGTEPRKLRAFLVQCELNFQNRPRAFQMDQAKVTFAQSYLKGMALEWFEPDLLQLGDPALRPDWMDDYREFVLELQTNFGRHDPVGDAEHQLDHLSMKDGQHINKYVVEFNRLATQVRGYGEGALRHHFYNGLPDRIKDEISCIGKPRTLGELCTLSQTIDGRYWERKSEVARQTKTSGTQPSTSKGNSNTSSLKPAQSSANPSTPNASSSSSKGKPFTPNLKPQSDLSSKLGKDGCLTAEERKHRSDLKLCMFCGNAGHMAKDCRKSSSSASKARAAKTATPETQPEASTTEAKK
ncbi:hypothetical protein PAXINDRAFT_48659, partial [Paxillus involutus ATCC 200175]